MTKFTFFVRILFANRLMLLGILMILIITTIGILAPFVAPYDPSVIHTSDKYKSPGAEYLLGTDKKGRDVLSRIIFGTRISLAVGALSIAISLSLGVLVGAITAYQGGIVDRIITEVTNALVAFPTVLLGILILSIWGFGFFKLIITLAASYFPRFVRISRGSALSVKEEYFVEAARASGSGFIRVVVRHILPNIIPENIVAGTLWISAAIISQAALSFLGLGIQPPTPTWGNLMSEGMDVLMFAPWLTVYPGLAILLTVVGFNLIGDGLRDSLDPKIRHER